MILRFFEIGSYDKDIIRKGHHLMAFSYYIFINLPNNANVSCIFMVELINIFEVDFPNINVVRQCFPFIRTIPTLSIIFSFKDEFPPTIIDSKIKFIEINGMPLREEDVINTIIIRSKSIRRIEGVNILN